MSGLLDTLMNLAIFAFIGLLVWLLVKPLPHIDKNDQEPDYRNRQ